MGVAEIVGETPDIAYAVADTPIGAVTVATWQEKVCWLSFVSSKPAEWELDMWCKRWLGNDVRCTAGEADVQPVLKQLDEYFAGKRCYFDVPIAFLGGTSFQQKVWQELLNIPYGEVRTYKEIAQAVGIPKAVRAVGGANNRNPLSIIVPCHRVIGSNGALVGYGGGLEKKEYLLRLEGYLQ
ncbi:methylated-DNA--[protein]-cysteine S-methyltransferase [Numidum massiliense]|uniref:methylated-DNA--[protein]-cysteine S-methyltransferase n=1 Tax=Numidum massiliense TaxID=1522315 RepID=UPI0006D59013|nr:methylated-DNA--[protein]-cysteine S-methyltransferase [Numidum massiliense]